MRASRKQKLVDPLAKELKVAIREVKGKIERIESETRDTNRLYNQKIADLVRAKSESVSRLREKKDELLRILRGYDEKAGNKRRVSKRSAAKSDDEKTIQQIIIDYMEVNQQSTTAEVSQYLVDIGRNTNPGVELGRLVSKAWLIKGKRGEYTYAR